MFPAPFLPEVPSVRASLPMLHECNGKIAAFLFRTGNTSDDYRPFVRYKAVIPAAFNHKDGRGINGHILSGYCSDPVDFMPAPPANAHSERPRSSAAVCASHHAGLFRHASFGQSSQSVAAHPAQYCFWKARSHGASITGNSRRKAANACGLSVIRSNSVTVLTSLPSRGRRPAPPLEMLLNGCLRPLCFVDFPLPAVQLSDVPPL